MDCIHHWFIQDDKRHHQIGQCKECGNIRDFGQNDTILSRDYVTITDYMPRRKGNLIKRHTTLPRDPFRWPDDVADYGLPYASIWVRDEDGHIVQGHGRKYVAPPSIDDVADDTEVNEDGIF